ncbi:MULTISPECIES: Fic family protein [unclassified Thiocapsa]|uniref:Fic family protein n=1 Tax=unclassified Thiocapsa TaxID=2641286 RepID=UPI0035B286A1
MDYYIKSEEPETDFLRIGSPEEIRICDPACGSGAQSESIVQALSDGPLSASELMEALGLESKTGAFKRAIKELLDQAVIAYTIPDRPGSRLQKYRLIKIPRLGGKSED